ncbi:MAG: sugar-binding protein, partial [Thermomicrobiales bacterium]
PYTGYVLETFIPFDVLPADLDPDNAAMNIFIYDSDTQDLTGQSRLGWSTWNGVQGDPYRWSTLEFDGYGADTASPVADVATPVAGAAAVDEPIMPLDVAQSAQSPQSIAQSAADGVPLAGRTPVAEGEGLTNVEAAVDDNGQLALVYDAGAVGLANYFLVDANGAAIGSGMFEVNSGEALETALVTIAGDPASYTLLVSFETEGGAVQALALDLAG